jgi:hypothetical protein|nr:MAG TPA: hypothetical protein [Caudoviricetes sp.]
MPRKKNPYAKAVTAQLTRIRKMLKSMEERGYEFAEDAFDLNRRNTQEYLGYLKSLTREAVYARAYHIDYDTGEHFTGEEYFSRERRQAYYRGRAAKQLKERMQAAGYLKVLDEHRRFLYSLPPALVVWERAGRGSKRRDEIPYGVVLLDAFERAIDANGEESVAKVIEANATIIQELDARMQQESTAAAIMSTMREVIIIYNTNFAPLSADEIANIETAADMLQGFSDEPSDMIPTQWR